MSLAQRSVDNPVAVNLFMWLIILGGLYYAITLEREMFPSFEPEQITLRVVQPGAVPEDLARSVTRLLERGLQGVDGVERITSRVTEGLSATTIEVQDGFDRTADGIVIRLPDFTAPRIRLRLDPDEAALWLTELEQPA